MSKEVLLVAEAVSNEKGVNKELIFEALEAALAMATKKRHPGEIDVRVTVDRKTGSYKSFRRWLVVSDDAEIENPDVALTLTEVKAKFPERAWVKETTPRKKSKPPILDALQPRPLSRLLCKKFAKRSGRLSLMPTKVA